MQLEAQLQDVDLASVDAFTYLSQLTVKVDLTEPQVSELILEPRSKRFDVCASVFSRDARRR